MMPVIAIATMLSAPAVDLCGMKAGQFQVGIVIAPTRAGAAPAPNLQAPQLQLPSQDKPGIQLSTPDGKGTEVRIPGLGKLGVLPKLDFGLDILYGAAEDRRTAPGSSANPDELTVRGSIKHKF